ncbi:MAG: hypothetical protein Q9222_001986 [Ikaeria aurantiellina]
MAKTKKDKAIPSGNHTSVGPNHDPFVSKLFDSSVSIPLLGPVEPISNTRDRVASSQAVSKGEEKPLNVTDQNGPAPTLGGNHPTAAMHGAPFSKSAMGGFSMDENSRKRKRRKKDEDDIEGLYMQRLLDEESREAAERNTEASNKRRKAGIFSSRAKSSAKSGSPDSANLEPRIADQESTSGLSDELPQHESLIASRDKVDLDKAARTVFLANVSTQAIRSKIARKTLMDHLVSFSSHLPVTDTPHKIESLRFRSTPFASGVGPKKAAFAKRELMDSTAKSTNAYAVYMTQLAARAAIKKLNGTILLDRHLLVDSVAHPRKTDHRRCVFVGNLGFVDDDSQMNNTKLDGEDRRPRKRIVPSDVEEGLWRQFSKAGAVESVRMVRDRTTRVGKGFAYVQFENEIGVEKALAYNDHKFPPLLPRTLRVTRAKKVTNSSLHKSRDGKMAKDGLQRESKAQYIPKTDSAAHSLSGRAGKLFGRAGAAHFKSQAVSKGKRPPSGSGRTVKAPEQFVFEGYRASSTQGKGAKIQGQRKREGKPSTRSSRRGTAFKATRGKRSVNRA